MPGYSPGIRDKLITIFVLIKVLPLIVLAWFAWNEISQLTRTLEHHVNQTAQTSLAITKKVGNLATENSIKALDIRSREAIERLSTDTAKKVADFLYERDRDIQYTALLTPDEENYRNFLITRTRPVTRHGPWVMNDKGDRWIPQEDAEKSRMEIKARNEDNELDFHYRPPEDTGIRKEIPLYLEITHVDLTGQETLKITSSDLMSKELKDISKKDNTFCKAESYFNALKVLKPGEIYVSEVIGTYVKTHMIGHYTEVTARAKNIDFKPEESAYAGEENPVGKRFQGLIRWAAPVVDNRIITGYVTMALNHDHIMEFTDQIKPTEQRYTDISDAGSGNYAFMWDYKGRNISHPRDYFITGYDPETGEPSIPWLDSELYELLKGTDLSPSQFLDQLPEYKDQALAKKPAAELIREGLVALDCRFLNFAPQCDGWDNITSQGGSGSFVIFWSGLLKLTTAASIPYFTGKYKDHPRGFGFITIGANVEEFHKPAVKTAQDIKAIENEHLQVISMKNRQNQTIMTESLRGTALRLTFYTAVMVFIVILIAIIMASTLTAKITSMIDGILKFEKGDMGYRLNIRSSDEMGQLGTTFNRMADHIQQSIADIKSSKQTIEQANITLRKEIIERIQVEKELQTYQDHLEELVQKRTLEIETKITQQEKTQKALQKSEEKFIRLFMVSPVWMTLTTLSKGRFLDVNQAFLDTTGHTRNEVIGSTTTELNMWVSPKDRKSLMTRLKQDGILINYPQRFVSKTGVVHEFLLSSTLLEIEGETCVISAAHDITIQRHNEREMEALRNTLRNIIDSMPSVIIGVDPSKKITLWNREAQLFTGINAEAAKNRSVFDLFPMLSSERKMIAAAIREGAVKRDEKYKIVIKEKIHFFDVTVYPLMGKEIDGAVIRVDNVSQRVRMEERMIQSEKMQSIGSLAAGMAHEINNPLAGIMQNAQVARNRIQENLPKNREAAETVGVTLEQIRAYMQQRNVPEMFDVILTAGRRAAEIVENMLSFSRKSEAHFERCNLSELLDKTLTIVQNDYDLKKKFDIKNIDLVREYDPDIPEINCDRSKIQQVFFNILKNGAQAMMGKEMEKNDHRFTLRHSSRSGMAVIEIEDNGPGMNETIKNRIFEPFFTTKPVGVGTGLGLYISYFIVAEDHKGSIAVRSTPGKGTTFIICLPVNAV